jgi:ribosomal protein S18 acetylase RimI-like enzyme
MSSASELRVADLRDDQVEQVLQADPGWTAYALSDLEPPFRAHSRFVGAEHGGGVAALVLIFRTPTFTSLLPYGSGVAIGAILDNLRQLPDRVFVVVGEEHYAILAQRYRLDVWPMYRMVATPDSLRVETGLETRVLTPDDLSSVEELYRHWETTFFQPMLLETGIFRGVFENGRLVAVAGTHTQSPRFRLATIGGVFTHPEYRGRGLARGVTGAVARDLVDAGVQLLALNVKQDNVPAIAAYRALGFTVHRPYLEGHASTR